MAIFKPNEIINRFSDFDIEAHRKMGFDTILIDIDNTIDIPDSKTHGSDEAFNFLNSLKENGFLVIIFSNNTEERILRFLNGNNYNYNNFSLKPLPFGYKKVIKKYKLDKKKVISFGDQLLTDCLGANTNGIYTVYVKPLINKDTFKTVINRKIEKLIFKYILHEKM